MVEEKNENAGRARQLRLLLGYFLAMAGLVAAAYVIRALQWGWAGTALVYALIAATTVAFVRAMGRQARADGQETQASRRYSQRMIGASVTFALGIFVATWLYKQAHLTGLFAWFVPLLPIVGAVAMIWAMAGFVKEEGDEYIRSVAIRQAVFGNRFLLVVATVWGFFEQFRLAPHVPAWAALPVFAIGLLVSAVFRGIRA